MLCADLPVFGDDAVAVASAGFAFLQFTREVLPLLALEVVVGDFVVGACGAGSTAYGASYAGVDAGDEGTARISLESELVSQAGNGGDGQGADTCAQGAAGAAGEPSEQGVAQRSAVAAFGPAGPRVFVGGVGAAQLQVVAGDATK